MKSSICSRYNYFTTDLLTAVLEDITIITPVSTGNKQLIKVESKWPRNQLNDCIRESESLAQIPLLRTLYPPIGYFIIAVDNYCGFSEWYRDTFGFHTLGIPNLE